MGQTVNLLSDDFAGSNPALPTQSGRNSTGRVSAFQAECCEFEPRRPLENVFDRINSGDRVLLHFSWLSLSDSLRCELP